MNKVALICLTVLVAVSTAHAADVKRQPAQRDGCDGAYRISLQNFISKAQKELEKLNQVNVCLDATEGARVQAQVNRQEIPRIVEFVTKKGPALNRQRLEVILEGTGFSAEDAVKLTPDQFKNKLQASWSVALPAILNNLP